MLPLPDQRRAAALLPAKPEWDALAGVRPDATVGALPERLAAAPCAGKLAALALVVPALAEGPLPMETLAPCTPDVVPFAA